MIEYSEETPSEEDYSPPKKPRKQKEIGLDDMLADIPKTSEVEHELTPDNTDSDEQILDLTQQLK